MDAVRRTVLVLACALGSTVLPLAAVHAAERQGAERHGAVRQGAVAHDGVVSADPADFTPNVLGDASSHSTVLALAQRGDTLFAGGDFHTVTDAQGTTTYQRQNLMAFSASTGQMLPFSPDVNGKVWSLAPYRDALFVAGEFTRVNGVPRPGIVKLDAVTGEVVSTFRPRFSHGSVTAVRVVDGRVVIGGAFPGRLRALDPRSGADTGFIDLHVAGSVADNAGPTRIYRFAVNPAATRLVAVGNFTSVGGVHRRQAFMLNLAGRQARVSPWYYRPLDRQCKSPRVSAYLRDVAFSPGGAYFVLVASGFVPRGHGVGRDICDAAARFETHDAHPRRPTWINYTGGDTLHSVAVSGSVVYVQGHQRWLDNPHGRNSAGPGAVCREGIGAIDPATGLALPWNPGKTRGIGGKDLLLTSAGLWVGSDGGHIGGEYHGRIAFFPRL